jgi:hypothetical protein
MGRAFSLYVRNAYKIFVGNREDKRPLGRSGCRWKYIEVYLK